MCSILVTSLLECAMKLSFYLVSLTTAEFVKEPLTSASKGFCSHVTDSSLSLSNGHCFEKACSAAIIPFKFSLGTMLNRFWPGTSSASVSL